MMKFYGGCTLALLAFILWFSWQPAHAQSQTNQATLIVYKTPAEQFLLAMDFTLALSSDPFTLNSVTSINVKTGADSTSQIIATSPVPAPIAGTDKVAFMVMGGSSNDQHNISVSITDTTTGAIYVGKVTLYVTQWP